MPWTLVGLWLDFWFNFEAALAVRNSLGGSRAGGCAAALVVRNSFGGSRAGGCDAALAVRSSVGGSRAGACDAVVAVGRPHTPDDPEGSADSVAQRWPWGGLTRLMTLKGRRIPLCISAVQS